MTEVAVWILEKNHVMMIKGRKLIHFRDLEPYYMIRNPLRVVYFAFLISEMAFVQIHVPNLLLEEPVAVHWETVGVKIVQVSSSYLT